MQHESSILILGADLQGCGIALELAHRGHRVVLVDQDVRPMNRASLRNEGKIHLGLIYAADASFATAELQLRGALAFHALLKRWCGDAASSVPLSTPYEYLVANDSILSVDQLQAHYEKVTASYHAMLASDPTLDYMGTRPDRLFARRDRDTSAKHFNMDRLQAVFHTEELAVDTDALADVVRRAILSHDKIQFLPGRRVASVQRTSNGFRVEGHDDANGAWSIDAEQVVNATWEGRFAIDKAMGLDVQPGWLHRLKYRVIGKLPPQLQRAPSATIVLGPYGDVVVRPNGTAYLSWYPTGIHGWSHDITPPAQWDGPCRGDGDATVAQEVARNALHHLDQWYPGIAQSEVVSVDAGVVVAYGKTDVDDLKSGLHDRTRVGVRSENGYHTVDPGKLTTAPLFAMQAADAIVGKISTAVPRVVVNPSPAKNSLHVVALMPAWRAAAFIEPVLQSLADQTYPNLTLLISDDCSPDNTAEICQRFVNLHSNFRLICQPKNLGWIGNVNALLDAAQGDCFFFAFHDDVLAPDYVAKLVKALKDHPRASVAFSDVMLTEQSGRQRQCIYDQLANLDDQVIRTKKIISRKGEWWVPNRGLFRADAARRIGGLKRHGAGEVTADWPWLVAMAIQGEFVRVPEPLCFKTYMPTSLSKTWRRGLAGWFFITLSVAREIRNAKLPIGSRIPLYVALVFQFFDYAGDGIGRRLKKLGKRGSRRGVIRF